MIAQQLLNGIISGAVYALFALGFTLIFGVQKVLNLAHGGVFMAGAFLAYYAVTAAGLPLWAALLMAMIACGLISVLIDLIAFRPIRARGGHANAEFAAIVASIGIDLVLLSIAQRVSDTKVLSFPFGTFPVEFFRGYGLRISLLQIAILALVGIMLAGLVYYLQKTSFGRQVRAVAINERAASLLGVNAAQVYFQTFFIAGAMAGIAGVLIGLSFNSIHFLMGEPYILKAFVVVVLGGLGNMAGAVGASLLLGIVQTLTIAYLPTGLSDTIIFGMLFIVLLFWPNGLFGGSGMNAGAGRQ